MIFGFNTDVKYAGTVYHVQSEAREHEFLLQTQVFVGGRCIGKHATSYADNIEKPEFSEEHMHDMLREQHKHFVTAVREGRIDAELTPREHQEPGKSAASAAVSTLIMPVIAPDASDESAAPSPPIDVTIPPPAATVVPPSKLSEGPGQVQITTAAMETVALPMDPLAAEFAAAVAGKPLDPGLTLTAVGSVIGKGVSVECSTPEPASDGIIVPVRIADESGPAACAQLSCRVSSGKIARYVYAISSPGGVADLHITLDGLDLASTSLLVQASYRGRSVSRKYQLARS